MNNIELFNHWIESSNEAYETMKILYDAKKYTWSLFFGHLVIEKILKGIYARENKENPIAPKTHDLIYLARKLNININDKQEELLEIITRFNVNTRYDNYRNEFYNKCTREYTKIQIKNIEEIRNWLKNL